MNSLVDSILKSITENRMELKLSNHGFAWIEYENMMVHETILN